MRIAEELADLIAKKSLVLPGLPKAAAELSATYRNREFATPALKTMEQRLAYLTVRMPATYGACWRALRESSLGVEEFEPKSMLDLGAGPGTATWAATESLASLQSLTLVERDASMVALGRDLMQQSQRSVRRDAKWVQTDLAKELNGEGADLVMISYVLGELPGGVAEKVVERAWAMTNQLLVIVEPGTRVGFQQVERIRAKMIASGATIAAPCPHHEPCPMAAAGDWCHFSQRVDRTAEHRRMKQGELGYEDEKFSYVAFTKMKAKRPEARIVRHPLYRPKQVQLTLCTAEGLKQTTVTKSQGDRYRAAKKAEWGDAVFSIVNF